MKKLICFTLALFVLSGFAFTLNNDTKNYYGIPDTITYDGIEYKLSDSYHPNEHYYKQEYIPAGEIPDHYNTMLIIDFYITDNSCKDMIQRKISELDERKKKDVVVNYQPYENDDTGDYMLDFVLSDSNGDALNLVERNIYHYKNYTDKAGHKGVLLFAISQRGYTDGITNFFKALKENRIDNINKLGSYPMPQIQLN